MDSPQFSEQLHSLTTEQLLVVDQLIQARARIILELSSLTTCMSQFASCHNSEEFVAAKQAAQAARERYDGYTIALEVALAAFRESQSAIPREITHLRVAS